MRDEKPESTEWYFEDYLPGQVRLVEETIEVLEDEVVAFGRKFDPQPFHVDETAAVAGPFGGLIASGWHTGSMLMRLFAKYYLSPVSSLGSPGIDELRWPVPVRPGDQLRLRTTVEKAHRSRSKPDRGVVHTTAELLNQDELVVIRMRVINLILARD
ncbi:acyl dehydratase [Tamaricihabitans halophyticus]|uniref:Acyl dehydratase n=1 Tax=Tamaricihabitans halophyticus TaxID=1262583 RepID=A0A4R2QMK1_9PSEU|nr:MaoC family dehydratase [Tamaricihabitans halophyticus]TCP50780.1 acyl dehydratase [Tamaricihabitans halophyticus]